MKASWEGWKSLAPEVKINTDSQTSQRLLSISEAANCLGCKVGTLYSWTSQKRIGHIKVGRLLKFDKRDLEKWIDQNRVEPVQ